MITSGLFSICINRKYYVMYIHNASYYKIGKNIQKLIEKTGVEKLTNIMDNINIIFEDQVMPHPVEWRSVYRVDYLDNILEKKYWIQEYGYEDFKNKPNFDKDIKYIYIIDLDCERFIIKSFNMDINIPISEVGYELNFK